MSFFLLLAAVAFLVSGLLSRYLAHPRARIRFLDIPNQRSMHTHPTPRTGGLAMFGGMFAGWSFLAFSHSPVPPGLITALLPLAMVLAASYLDDRDALPPRLRLGVHIAAAVVLILFGPLPTRLLLPGLEIPLALPVGALLTVIYVTWLINLYNFMDGLDGLAGGMGVIGFGTFAVLGGVAGHVPFSAVNLIIATATAGFLLVNFPPARLFMGDIGSTGLGLLAAVMSLWGDTNGIFPLWIGILVFSPFFVDASLTLLIRLIRKDNLFEAHQDHWYQQLARSGRSARRVLSIEYPLMLGCAASALLAPVLTAGGQWVVIGLWFGLYAVLLTRFLQKGFRSDSAR